MRGFRFNIALRVCILSRAFFGVLVMGDFPFNNSAGELLLNKLGKICLYYELSLALCDSIKTRGFELSILGFLIPFCLTIKAFSDVKYI